MKHATWICILPLVVAILGAGGALLMSLGNWTFKYEEAWVRALLQVGLVGVFGLVISVVLENFKDGLQQRRDASKLRFDTLTDFSRTYMDVKIVRRRLQATKKFTAREIDELNQLQVQIELHKHVSVHSFKQHAQLLQELEKMEKYLNHAANDPNSSERSGFLSKGFRDFADAYKYAIEIIQKEIATR